METPPLIHQSCDFCGTSAAREAVFLLQEFLPFAPVLSKELETLTPQGRLVVVVARQKGRNKIIWSSHQWEMF